MSLLHRVANRPVPYFPGCPVSWPHCPASRPRPSRDAKCPVFGRAQIVLKCCSKRMQDRNVLVSKLKFGQLILRKIIKIVAIRCHILKLKCIKFDLGWGSAPQPAGGAYSALPDSLAGFKAPTSKGGEGKGKEWRPVFSVQFVGNPTVTCEIKIFQNYFSLRRRPPEIIFFQCKETCVKSFQNYF